MWHSHPDFGECIKFCWNSRVKETTMFKIVKKLENITREVNHYKKTMFGSISLNKRKRLRRIRRNFRLFLLMERWRKRSLVKKEI